MRKGTIRYTKVTTHEYDIDLDEDSHDTRFYLGGNGKHVVCETVEAAMGLDMDYVKEDGDTFVTEGEAKAMTATWSLLDAEGNPVKVVAVDYLAEEKEGD